MSSLHCPLPLRLLLASALLSTTGLLQAEGFMSTVGEARKTHFKFVPIAAYKLLMEDKPDEAMQSFVKAVPDDKLTAADCFILGETFFRYDIDKAAKYYRRAHELLPDEPETNLELARSLHRQGHHPEAGLRYERYLATNPDRFVTHALLAECLIRAGKLKEAVAHWEKAGPEENRSGISGGIFEVHGAPSPIRRRADLLKAVQAGQTAKMENLIVLSATWDDDWSKSEVNKLFLQKDLDRAKQVLVNEPRRLVELTLYGRTYLEEVTPEWLKEELETGLWLIGDDGRLPDSVPVAERLMDLAVKHRLADIPTLLTRFEKELRLRAFGKNANDPKAARLLVNMLTLAGKTRAADVPGANLAGWERYHDPLMAADYLASKMNENKLKYKSPELRRAMTEFPLDPMLCMLDMLVAEDEGEESREIYAAAIQSEFTLLSPSIGKIRDISRLNVYFGRLKAYLDKQVMEK